MAAAFGAVGGAFKALFGRKKKKPEEEVAATAPPLENTVPASPPPTNKLWSDAVLAGAQQAQRVLGIQGAKKQRRPGVNAGLQAALGAMPKLRGVFS